MPNLESIVENMVVAEESEENIKAVIEEHNATNGNEVEEFNPFKGTFLEKKKIELVIPKKRDIPVEEEKKKEDVEDPDLKLEDFETLAKQVEKNRSESIRLMNDYRLDKNESDEDLYERITPISGTQGAMVYNFNTGKYQFSEDIDSPMTITSSTTTIDGITKNNSGVYINQNNEPASEKEILKFEELTTLNNIHNEALKLKSNLAANYEISDSELLEDFDKDNFEKNKKEKIEKGVVNDNLNFDFESYLNYKTKKQQDGFANFLAKTNAPLTAKHQSDYNALTESKLPALQEKVVASYQSEIDNTQKSIVDGYQPKIDKIQKDLLAKYQERANLGIVSVDRLSKWYQQELEEVLNPIYDKLDLEIKTSLKPINDNINKDINSALKIDKDVIALDEEYQTQYESLQEKQWEAYVKNII